MSRRANALIPLSWDHHHGLNLVRTLRGALEGEGRYADLSAEAMRKLVAARWSKELSGHFADEEAVLIPAAAKHPALGPLVERMRREHALIRGLVSEVAASGDDDSDALRRFADALEAHIRFEERELFEAVEAGLDEAAHGQLGETLMTRRLADGRGSERELKAVRGELLPKV